MYNATHLCMGPLTPKAAIILNFGIATEDHIDVHARCSPARHKSRRGF